MSAALAPQLALVASVPTEQPWLSAEQVMHSTGWSAFWLREQVKRGKVLSRATDQRAKNGRVEREYLASSLPPSAAPQTRLALVPAKPESFGPLFANVSAAQSTPIMLPDLEDQKQAAERFAVITPLLHYADDRTRFASLRLADGTPVTSRERLITYVAETQNPPVCPMTIKRWLHRFHQGGVGALADKIRADKGQSRWFAKHRDAAMISAYLHLKRQSIVFIREQIKDILHLSPDELPSRETIRAFLAENLSPAIQTLALEGKNKYEVRMSPYLTRGYTDIYANQYWVVDHMIHDLEVANDLFEEEEFGAPIRLRLTGFIDMRSRKVMGVSWAWEGSSRSLAAAFYRGLQIAPPPQGIYTDNGKDMKKFGKGAGRNYQHRSLLEPENWQREEWEGIEKTGLIARLGIAMLYCLPRHGQSKHIERFWETVHTGYDACFSTYTTGSVYTRPDETSEQMMRHRHLLRAGRVAESKHPLASRFILGCLAWIEEYNNTPHSGEGMDGRTPNDVFATEQDPTPKPMADLETLALLMSEFERREVHECAVRLNKRRYTPRPEDRAAWAAMHERNEREILVAYVPGDPEYATALDLDGRFIASLEMEAFLRFAPNDPATQAQIGDSMEIRRHLEKSTRKCIKTIEAEARAVGAKSPQELLYDRLQLPAIAGNLITHRKPRLAPDKHAVAPKSSSEIASSILEELL